VLSSARGNTRQERFTLRSHPAAEAQSPWRRGCAGTQIQSGDAVQSTGKKPGMGQDFWNGYVGSQLGADMDVETWIRGAIPPVADTDGIHKAFDIKFINVGPLGAHWAWPETHRHAKWGITKDSDWICVGDINRMISQRKRGGGTRCTVASH